ncbi:MAG: M3 family metallopeptidase [Deltaproteobacteria bacterium]|jgi:peptidyl-dipeptidase Dcp|nr:M3 family metallopeptidase [Deltaproteobacteria bacterium]
MANISDNPFFLSHSLFDNAVPFDKIQNHHFVPALDAAITLAKDQLSQLVNNPDAPTFDNTILKLETCSEKMEWILSCFGNLEIANGTDEMHLLAKEIYPKSAAFSSDVSHNPELFKKVKFVYDHKASLKLTKEQARLLEKTYKSFVRNGALLSPEEKEKLRAIDQELSLLSPQFSENVLKATNKFEMILNKEDLSGLPESAIEAAHEMALKKGLSEKYLVNLQIPSYVPFITYSQSRDLREKLFKAYNSKSFNDEFDNQNNILKILHLRSQRAKILGYKTHADFVLEERMAKNPDNVISFLRRLLDKSKAAALKDYEEVANYALEQDQLKDFKPWDFPYYSEKLKEHKYAFHEEDLKPYFKLENAVQGIFEHARKLYGLVFKANLTLPTYHPDVKVYEIYSEKGNVYMGLFYTDFFPRETKKNGAWMTTFREQGLFENQNRRPHVSIVCNFTKPTATKPSLLNYDEVRTLFHEFGHSLHGILSNCSYRSLSGTNVFWDFVELPSQIMENWVQEKEGLDVFANHYETHQLIPKELVEKLVRSQKYLAGWSSLRQIQFALLDMTFHLTDPQSIKNVDEFETQATAESRILPKIAGTNSACSFSHVFAGGYSAGYYSYKWAEVLDADAFEFFKEKGIFNSDVASSFKENILSSGGTEDPMEIYKRFRGREPDPDALLRRDGLN